MKLVMPWMSSRIAAWMAKMFMGGAEAPKALSLSLVGFGRWLVGAVESASDGRHVVDLFFGLC